jgi:hypothetical protein
MTRVRMGFLPIVFVATSVAQGQGARPDSGRCAGHWSPPFPIQRADGRPVYIERGVITPFGDQTLALGGPTIFWLRRDHMAPPQAGTDSSEVRWAFTRAGALIGSDGVAVGIPPVDTLSRRGAPHLAGFASRSVTVAWASTDSATPSPTADADRVDVAAFDGTRWSTPATIIRAQHVRLEPAPAVRGGVERDPSVIAVAARDGDSAFVRGARWSGGRWSSMKWRGPVVSVHHATAVSSDHRAISLVMMASITGLETGVYSLHGQWDRDSVAWDQPALIDSIRGSFEAFSSARLGRDSLIVTWHSDATPGAPGAMKTALSIDAGRTWRLTAPLTLSSGMDGALLVVDAGGRLHVVYRGAREIEAHVLNAPGLIMHSRWVSGEWTRPTAISTTASVTAPGAGHAGGGRLMAIWTDVQMAQEGVMPKSVASLWTPGCARP